MRTIPISPQVGHQTLTCLLDGIDLTFDVRWNERANAWTITFSDDRGVIVASRRVAIGVAMLARESSPRLPPGDLLPVASTSPEVEAGRDDLGARVQLVYLSAAEIADAIRGAP